MASLVTPGETLVGTRAYAWIALAVAVAVGLGWLVGVSGRATIALDLSHAEERGGFLEARALVLEGRVDLLLLNGGDAGRRFREAHAVVERVQTRFRESGQAERAGQLAIALGQLTEAEQLAGSGDGSAQNAAEAALRTLEFVEAFDPTASEESSPSTRP
jgi:hypothetical protein